MNIELHGKYVTKDGLVVTIVRDDNCDHISYGDYPLCGDNGEWYTRSGKYVCDSWSERDLISEYIEPAAEPATEYGPWIGWNGGECPVDDRVTVQPHFHWQTRQQAEKNRLLEMTKLPINWVHQDVSTDIIAYRVKITPEVVVYEGHWDARLRDFYELVALSTNERNVRITMQGDDIKAEWV